jgi:tRNA modification GTPase
LILQYKEDTIAAIATPNGTGALGIIRISGPRAIEKANLLFPQKDLLQVKSHTLHFGPLMANDELIDEVLVSVFRAPRSFTGEDSIEISVHGSPYILQKTMEALVHLGVRPAEPGEFTMRAFLKGRMDLSQAEAVADLIAAESEAAHRTALQQMRGGFSQKIKALRQQLLYFASLIELELDFSEEDVAFADKEMLKKLLEEIYNEVNRLVESFRVGNAIKSGVKVVIAGRPNAGKSTLLNNLLNEERAIVSEIPGTTRDTIEDVMVIDGIKFRFIDTAGIRESTDVIEKIGVARTFEKIKEADIVIYLYDINSGPDELKEDLEFLEQQIPASKIIAAGNKADLVQGTSAEKKIKDLFDIKNVIISAKEGRNIDALKSALIEKLQLPDHINANETIITNIRHYNSLVNILKAVNQIEEGIDLGITGDLLAADIREALRSMSEITGEITSDEILGTIFSKFCIGK